MAIVEGFRANAANSVYLSGKSRYGAGSFLFFDAQGSTDPLSVSSSRGLFVDSSDRLSYWNGTSTVRLTGTGGIATTWEDLYIGDATFALTSATWTITQSAAAALLTLTKSNVGAGAVLVLNNSGTGDDITGTSSLWSVTAAGLATFATNSVIGGVLKLGSGAANGTLQSNGNYDLILQTGNATTMTVTLVDGANGDVDIAFNGTGKLDLAGTTEGNDALKVGAGDVVVTLGAIIGTDNDNAASLQYTNNTATTIGAAASGGVINFISTSLTTGALVNLELTEGTLNGGYYLQCWDATGGARVASIGEDGVTTLAGSEGSNVLVLTKGDAVLSDGSLTITDDDNAASLSVTNDTATTATPFVLAGSGAFTGTTSSSFMTVTASGLTTGTLLYLATAAATTLSKVVDISSLATTGNGITITMTGTQTGVGSALSVVADSATTPGNSAGEGVVKISADGLTTGTALDVTSTAGNAITTGRLADFSHISGNITGTLNKSADMFNVSSNRTVTTGTVSDDFDMVGLVRTSEINGGGSFAATGSVLRIENAVSNTSGTVTDTVKGLEIVMDSLGTGDGLEITHAATGGIALNVIGAATTVDDVLIATTGVKADNKGALQVTNSGATAAGGSILRVINTGTPAAATSYLVDLDYSGATMTNNPTTIYINGKDSTNSTVEINSSGAQAANKGMLSLLNSNTGATGVVLHSQHTSTGSAANNDDVFVLKMEGLDSGDAVTEYGRITTEIQVVTAGQEDGRIRFDAAADNGTLTLMATINPRAGGALAELVMGSGANNTYVTTSGAYDLILDTNQGTNSGNITIADGANGNITFTPNGTGNVAVAGAFATTATETIAAGGTSTALSLAKVVHYIDADAGGDTFTLADGIAGQIMTILLTSSTGTATITPTNLAGGTSVTLNADGDTVVLQFMDTEWFILGGNSYAIV